MSKITKKTAVASLITLLIGIVACFFGCSDTTTNSQADNLDVSYTSTSEITDRTADILVLDTVKILIKDIKVNVSGSGDTTNFKVGPYVFYLNFKSNVNIVNSTYIPPGTFDKIIFDIHKLNDNETPPDPDFADINGRYSTVVKGKFNGVNFVFKSDKSVHQILSFPVALTVSLSGKSNITIQARPYIWFYKNGVLMNPNDPLNAGEIENNIKNNINNNFKAFKDNNRDGQPDS